MGYLGDYDRFMFGGTKGSFVFENNYCDYDASLGLGTLPDQPDINEKWRSTNVFSNVSFSEFNALFENTGVIDDAFPQAFHSAS